MVLSGSPPANFDLALYLNSKIRKPAESNNKNPNKVERAQVFNQPGFINSLDIVFSKIFHTNFHSELLKDTSLQSSPKSLLTKLTNNINEFLVSVLSALLEDPSKSRKLLSEQAHAYSQGYAGGLHNAINTHIAMAKIATQKLIEKGLKFNSIEFENNLEAC